MCNVSGLMPACCPQGNMGVYWIFADDELDEGLGIKGHTGWDDFHGWGMSCDGPGFFQVQFCPWCGRELKEPYCETSERRISLDAAIMMGQDYYNAQVAQRQKDMAELDDGR